MSKKQSKATSKLNTEDFFFNPPKPSPKDSIVFTAPFKCKNKTQKDLIQSIEENDVTVCIGSAGTGKSYSAINGVLNLLKKEEKYNKILFLKPMVQLNGEEMGILPGSAQEKMMYQNLSFTDSLYKLIGDYNVEKLIETKLIDFGIIGFIRGQNWQNCLIVVDECQNISKDNLKTILTRLSEGSKIILMGDPGQIDLKHKESSSLQFFVDKIKSRPEQGIGLIEFSDDDIVRHRLTKYFINIFKEPQTEQNKPLPINKKQPRVQYQIKEKTKLSFWDKFLKEFFFI
jgi:phosphate starvation-inducible PhoH-like protein